MSRWPRVPLGEVLKKIERKETVDTAKEYRILGVRLENSGPFLRETVSGSQTAATKLSRVETGDFIYSRLFAWRGAFGVIPTELDGCYVSNEFPTFSADPVKIDAQFLNNWFRLKPTINAVAENCTGSTPLTRNRFKENFFFALQIPLPPLAEQRRLVERIDALAAKIDQAKGLRVEADKERELLVHRAAAAVFQPDRWISHALGNLLIEDSRNGLGTRPNDEPPGVPILRISAGTSRPDAVVDEADYKYLPISKRDLEIYQLKEGDLLACRFNGNLRYVGRFSIYLNQQSQVQVYPDKLIRFRVDRSRVLPEFVSSQ